MSVQDFLLQYVPNQYLRAAIVLVAFLIAIRFLLSVLGRISIKLVSKTKSEIDDILIKKVSGPITVLAFLISIKIALYQLELSQNLAVILSKTIYSFFVLVIGYFIYSIIDIAILHGWTRIANKTRTKIDDSIVSILYSVIKIAIILLAALYILDFWGVKVGPFLAGLGIAGLAVALALQPTLSNIFSGVSLVLDKSVRVGDFIMLENLRGTIDKIGLRSTKIKTPDNELVVVPNSVMANSKIQNLSLPEPKTRITVHFSLPQGADVDKAKRIVLSELKKVDGAMKEHPPEVKLVKIANNPELEGYIFISDPTHRINALDDANTRVYNALKKLK